MKKICVSTYCDWSSYGSVLQAIGLKTALMELGYSSFIVQTNPAPNVDHTFPFIPAKEPKELLSNILSYFRRELTKERYKNSLKFIGDHTDILYYNDYETLRKNPPDADYYLAGSDQIWNPAICHEAFFLEFSADSKKRLSYAASMGNTTIPEEKRDLFNERVGNIDIFSVREREMVEVLKHFTNKPVQVHIDPTFLVTAEKWRTYEREYVCPTPYILVYAIYWDNYSSKQLIKLKKKTGYDIVAILPGNRVWANHRIFDADPGQFLYLVDHAEAVISSSFHGAALALNFNKRVCAVIDPAAPSRIKSLFNILNVENVDILSVMDFDLSQYEKINERILQERERSRCYLREILSTDELY